MSSSTKSTKKWCLSQCSQARQRQTKMSRLLKIFDQYCKLRCACVLILIEDDITYHIMKRWLLFLLAKTVHHQFLKMLFIQEIGLCKLFWRYRVIWIRCTTHYSFPMEKLDGTNNLSLCRKSYSSF